MQVACPRCSAAVEWCETSKYRPFCSERCKHHDLGAWANEEYVIPSVTPEEMLDPETTPISPATDSDIDGKTSN